MFFGTVTTNEAEGAILAHSEQAGARRIRKGQVLSAEDIKALIAAGVGEITVARLEGGDVHEDVAATRLAKALAGQAEGAHLTSAATGRVNLVADRPGLARIDAEAVAAVNDCDPMITCATVAPLTRLTSGNLIATIKIISYAVPEARLLAAEAAAQRALGLIPVKLATATLIETRTEASTTSDKGVTATRGRLEALGMELADVKHVPHTSEAIAAALTEDQSDLSLILTASATSDPFDTAPEGLRRAGGSVTRFGMPVDPGNLLFLGQLGARPVIGLPGCARAPALNGADWVLERVACGIDVTDQNIAKMGVGGLLKEIPSRPRPRRMEKTDPAP